MDNLTQLITLALFIAYIAWREHKAALERSQMADRLLARQLSEYKLLTGSSPAPDAYPLTDELEYEYEQTRQSRVMHS